MKDFIFRSILPSELEQAIKIEQICFPPNEACAPERMAERVNAAPDLFLVAIDVETGKLAGFLNGFSTMERKFRDEFFTDISLYDPKGTVVMIFGLDVLPEYRRQHLATELMRHYAEREREKGRELLVLTCLEEKVKMYEGMGFVDLGLADSAWGGEAWHEMSLTLQ